jgi:hypothetical protein
MCLLKQFSSKDKASPLHKEWYFFMLENFIANEVAPSAPGINFQMLNPSSFPITCFNSNCRLKNDLCLPRVKPHFFIAE